LIPSSVGQTNKTNALVCLPALSCFPSWTDRTNASLLCFAFGSREKVLRKGCFVCLFRRERNHSNAMPYCPMMKRCFIPSSPVQSRLLPLSLSLLLLLQSKCNVVQCAIHIGWGVNTQTNKKGGFAYHDGCCCDYVRDCTNNKKIYQQIGYSRRDYGLWCGMVCRMRAMFYLVEGR